MSSDGSHDIGDVGDELVIAELQLLVFSFMIVLSEHIFLYPLRYVMGLHFLIGALDVIFAELILFIIVL